MFDRSRSPGQSAGAAVVVTCGDGARARWSTTVETLGARVVDLADVPTRTEIDPLLDDAARLVVAGSDAALAAVVVRLLRREHLGVPVALLPEAGSAAARVWGLPTDPDDLAALARHGDARPAPLVRDDHGGLIVGHHEVGPFDGRVYCDEHLLADGPAAGLVVHPHPGGVAAAVSGPRRLGGLRAGRTAARAGRAVQIGCRPATVVRDGVPADRPLQRRSWYRHVEDWWFVRP